MVEEALGVDADVGPVRGGGGEQSVQVAHRVGGLLGGQIVGVGGSVTGRLARVGLDQLPTVEQFHQLGVSASGNPLTDQMFRCRVERLADLNVVVAVHDHLRVDRHLVRVFGCGQQRRGLLLGKHLGGARADGAVDVLPGLLRAPGLGAALCVGQIDEFLTGEEVSAHVLVVPLDPWLVLG